MGTHTHTSTHPFNHYHTTHPATSTTQQVQKLCQEGPGGEPNGAVASQRERSKHEVPGCSQNNSVTHPATKHKQRYTCSSLELTHQHSHWRGISHTTQKIQGTGGCLGGSRRRGRSHLHKIYN